MLVCVPPKGPSQTETLLEFIKDGMTKNISSHKFISSMDEYNAIPADEKYTFDIMMVQLGTTCAGGAIKDQVLNSKTFKWVHSLSSGIDGYVAVQEFKDSDIPLTNAKGAFSTILGEYVALGVLYHCKHLESFMQKKAEKKWEIQPVELVSTKTMAIIGYGDIGAATAKIAKFGFGMKVIGVKRNPADCSDLYKSYCDEILPNTEYEKAIKDADFVVGVLPKLPETVEFFNMETTFSKMKKTAVFMNIGRGPTQKETDLIQALKEGTIAGAVLDVFQAEPLVKESELWSLPNVLITPHCAQQDSTFMKECMFQFQENLENFVAGNPLKNVTDKKKGY